MITDPTPSSEHSAQAGSGKRSPWFWVSLALVVVAAGLAVWGLSTKSNLDSTQSDLDKSNQQVKQLQASAEQKQGVAGTIVESFKGAYQELSQQLGSTNEDLAATQQDLKSAEQAAADAQQRATQAKQTATDKANSAKDRAKATSDQLTAEADAAKAQATVAADCAKASISSLSKLFEGDNLRAQAQAVKQQLQSIAADCKTAFAGA